MGDDQRSHAHADVQGSEKDQKSNGKHKLRDHNGNVEGAADHFFQLKFKFVHAQGAEGSDNH